MPGTVDHIVILGSTLTALALVRHCRALGMTCDVVDTKGGPATASTIPRVTLIEGSSEEEVLTVVKALGRPVGSAIVADSDAWVRWIVKYRESLEKAFELVLHPSSKITATCLDKSAFLSWCHEIGLPAPRLYQKSLPNDSLELLFPVMVRPRETRHGMLSSLPKAAEIRSNEALGELLDQYDREGVEVTICESLLRPNIRQYSVGLARNTRGDVRAIVAEKVRPPAEWCAGGTYVVASHDGEVKQLAVSTAKALGLFGIAEIEILKDEDTRELFLIEVNPRPWVQYSLAWKSGYDLLTFLVAPNDYCVRKETTTGNRWICLSDDLYVAMSRSKGLIGQRKLTLRKYLSDLIAANVFAYWSVADLRPWLRSVAQRFDRMSDK